MGKDTLQKQLDELRLEYKRKLPKRITEIEESWLAWMVGGWSQETLKKFYQLIHTLSGTSGTFGYTALSNAANILEIYLKNFLKYRKIPTDMEQSQIEKLLNSVQETANQGSSLAQFSPEREGTPTPISPKGGLPLFLVEDDDFMARELVLQVSHFGYRVYHFNDLEKFKEALTKITPCAVIMDVTFPDDPIGGIKAVAGMDMLQRQNVPIIFISSGGDLESRLQAIRAGGRAYITKPFGIEELIDVMERFTSPEFPDPLRILVIEDEKATAIQYALTLQKAGMVAEIVPRPEESIDILVDFKPDLVLMDMYMAINGLELATVIRQHPSFMSLPIIFVSTEANLDKHMVAISMGMDDFLTKPVQPHHLVMTVRARARRARLLKSLMVRDSLTGLYNHTTLKERLNFEASRASREKVELSLAMIDLDHFKSVNDNYGHSMGDRVLKSLSRLLKQRLRKTDILGRYGGEEFAVLFPNTSPENAVRVMEEIRQDFADIHYHVEGKDFFVTFSCGIAGTNQFQHPRELNDAADQALYKAKEKGRNCVVLSEEVEKSPREVKRLEDSPKLKTTEE